MNVWYVGKNGRERARRSKMGLELEVRVREPRRVGNLVKLDRLVNKLCNFVTIGRLG
jgi:hypothetical protein